MVELTEEDITCLKSLKISKHSRGTVTLLPGKYPFKDLKKTLTVPDGFNLTLYVNHQPTIVKLSDRLSVCFETRR